MTTKTISYTDARQSLAKVLDEVINDVRPIVISRRGKRNAVIIPEDEYNAMKETLYLLSGDNGKHLKESIQQANEGNLTPLNMDELKAMAK